ncbi:MAG TPA: response regulator [Stellaceae bacterium]|nr:response regulator [Stellaceae bacterium]
MKKNKAFRGSNGLESAEPILATGCNAEPTAADMDMELALEAGEIGTWDWDLSTGRMRWSAQMARNMGRHPDKDDDVFSLLLEAVHPSDRAAASAFAAFRTRIGPIRIEARLVWPGDEPHWVVFLGRTLAGPGGVPARMVGITIDSTRRRKTEEAAAVALQESEQRLREVNRKLQQRAERRVQQLGASRAQMQAIFDNTPDWLTLFRATADGRFIYEDLNHATERAYGLDYDQIVGHPLEDILGVEQAQLPLRLMRACIETGENQRYTARRTLAGVTRAIDVMFVRVPETQDGDYLIMATARDITEREEMEEQLRQSQKMEAVGQLTGGLAHDFNNLLTAVIGNLDLLAPRVADDAIATRYLKAAQRGAENGAKLTEQLLAFSRRQHLHPQAINLNAIISGMRELLARTIGPTIRVRTALAPDLWPALVDPIQIEVAILNLALNGRDAMPSGGTLTIETGNLAGGDAVPADLGDKDCIRLSVRDTGMGMSDEVMRSAIEPFFTTKEAGKGSGLGLSQVYGMVRQSNGGLQIETRVGAGTAVHVYLPRSAEIAASGDTPDKLREQERTGARIIVVDDDPVVRDVILQMLDEVGYSATGVESGQAALDRLERGETYDLMVTDIAMPGLSGIETVQRARKKCPELRVLYATGYADIVGDDHHTGSDPRLKKPFRLAELATEVHRAITRPPPLP